MPQEKKRKEGCWGGNAASSQEGKKETEPEKETPWKKRDRAKSAKPRRLSVEGRENVE